MASKAAEGERLVKLALFIKERGPVGFAQIRGNIPEYNSADEDSDAAKAEARVRRLFERDKDTLAACGLLLRRDAENHYTLDAQASYAAPVELTAAQTSLLRMLCAALLDDKSYHMKTELRLVVAKLADEIDAPDLLPTASAPADVAAPTVKLPGFAKLRRAIERRKRIRFEYTNAQGKASKREAEPAGCFFLRGRCYLVALDTHAQAMRSFRLDRMAHISVNATAPNAPDFEPRPFNASDYCGLPFQFGAGAPFTACVRFAPSMAWRAESLCLGMGSLEECDDGALAWQVQARDATQLATWCAECGPGVVPQTPAAAAQAYRDGLARVAAWGAATPVEDGSAQ